VPPTDDPVRAPMPGVQIRPHESAETRALLASTDWSATPLGPMSAWPVSLRSSVETMLSLATPAIIFWGPEQTQIYNDGYAVIMGPRHPRYFGASYRDSWPETYPVIYPWMRRVLDAGEVVTVDETLIPVTRYGFVEEAYFTFTFSPLRDDDGRIAGILQPVVEVTDRVLSVRRGAALRTLGESAGDIDPAQGDDLIDVDERDLPFAVVYAWDPGQERLAVTARSENLRGHDEAIAALEPAVRAAYETRSATDLEGVHRLLGLGLGPWEEPADRAVIRPLRAGARRRLNGVAVLGVSPRLHRDAAYLEFLDQVANLLGAGLQRAELRRSEERARAELDVAQVSLRHRTAQFEQLVRMAPVGVYLVDEAFRIREVNPIAKPVFGDIPGLIGSDFRDVIRRIWTPEFAERVVGLFAATLKSGEPYVDPELAERRIDRDVTEYYDWRIDRIPLPDGGSGVVCYFRDISEQVRIRQALEEANRRKDEFLAMLGHELRNPLGPIRAGAELLGADGADGGTRRRAVEIIERQTRHLTRLVDDLLDVSRIMQNKVRLVRRPVGLSSVIEQAVETTRPMLDPRQQALELAPHSAEVTVECDETRLVQVVANLLHNASKFSPDGGRICVEWREAESEAEITVRDEGIGMPAELVPNVFELFVQGDASLDRTSGGLGIGLTLARQLVELHGGSLEASSAGEGTGSTFVIHLPIASTGAQDSGDGGFRSASARDRLRVLIVDDNADMVETMAAVVELEGHRVRTARDGATALESIEADAPDVVVCDIGLPLMSGYEVAARIRDRWPGITIIALSGYGHEEARRAGAEAGFDAYLVKPVDMNALLDRIAEHRPPTT
jgi:PAS domain S-box-containing protein